MGRERKDTSHAAGTSAAAPRKKRAHKWDSVMKQPNPAATPKMLDDGSIRLTVCLTKEAAEDLANIAEVYERRTGCIPSRSAVIRAALSAEWDRIK